MELIHNLGFDKAEELDIPEEHKKMVRKRIKKSDENPDRLLDWNEVKDKFRFD